MTEEVIIRDITTDDIDEVVALGIVITGSEGPVAQSGVIDSYLSGELGLSCVAEIGGQIVGYILGRLAFTPIPVTASARIQLIGTGQKYRRRGIATRLINNFRRRCREKGIKTMHISVPVQDTTSQTFLQRCGFRNIEWTHLSAIVQE